MSSIDGLPVKWHESNGHTHLPEVNDIEETWLRERYERCLVGKTGSDSGSHIHLPENDNAECTNTLCDTKASEWNNKPFGVFPMGYKPICKRCFSKEYNNE